MECPNCGSTKIHRSRRRGFYEHVALAPFSIYPYRCSACRKRFRRYHADRRRDPVRIFKEPPPIAKAMFWFALMIVVGIALSYIVARFSRR